MPEMSVIVLNWNGRHFLETCLTALRRQSFQDFETILVDNGSTDGSAEYVLESFPEVKLVSLPDNRGFCGGNLAGYQKAIGELIVLLNNDTEAHPEWLLEIRKASREYSDAGSFASKMLNFKERDRIDLCGFDLAAAGTTLALGRGERDGEAWSGPRNVFGACAGAAAYRRTMLEDIGFLDEDFFMTYEDLDLSLRAQLRGYGCMFVPGAIVYHRYRATRKKDPGGEAYYSQRNIELAYIKSFPLGLIFRSLPQRVIYEIGSAIYFTRLGAGRPFVKAKLDAVRQLSALLRKRREIQARRTVSPNEFNSLLHGNHLKAKWSKFCSAWRKPTFQRASG